MLEQFKLLFKDIISRLKEFIFDKSVIKLLAVAIVIFNTLDWVFTVSLISIFNIGIEANPIASFLLNLSPIIFIIFKHSINLPILLLAERNNGKKSGSIAIWVLFVIYYLLMLNFVFFFGIAILGSIGILVI